MNESRSRFVLLSILLVPLFTSCDKEWIHIFDKVENCSFITDGCDRSVTISQASDRPAAAVCGMRMS